MIKLNQNGGSKTDTVVKLILVFFVSLLSFSVGTFVGKQFSDSQHRLATLEKDYHNEANEGRSTASVPSEGLEVQPSEILSQDDVAKLAEEFVQETKPEAPKRDVANTHEEKSNDAHSEKAEEELKPTIKDAKETEATVHKDEVKLRPLQETKPTHAAKAVSPQDAAHKIAEGKPAVQPVVKPEAPKKIELPKVTATDVQGKYTIQVSSHPNEVDAKSQASDLVSKGYSAFYVPAQIDGKTWYRVSVGNFSTADTAKEYLSKIKSNASFKDAIVRKVVQ